MTPDIQLSQEQMLAKFIPMLRRAKHYKKTTKVLARVANAEEDIRSITASGVETTNVAQPGDWIMENQTEAREQYVVKPEKFIERYEYDKKVDDTWDQYHSRGFVLAIQVDAEELNKFALTHPFHFEAPWREAQIFHPDDFLVCPPDFSEVYRIGNKEFLETYKRYPIKYDLPRFAKWFLLFLTLALAGFLSFAVNPVQGNIYDIIDLELAGNPIAAKTIVDTWNSTEAQIAMDLALKNIQWDTWAFIPIYTLTLLLWIWLSRSNYQEYIWLKEKYRNFLANSLAYLIMFLVVLAAMADWIENSKLTHILEGNFTAATTASCWATLKFFLLLGALLYLVGSGLRHLEHIFFSIKPIQFIVLITALFVFLLFFTPQGQELFMISIDTFVDNDLPLLYWFFFAFLATLFFLGLYDRTRAVYKFYRTPTSSQDNQDYFNSRYNPYVIRIMEEWICALIVLAPIMAFILGYFFIPKVLGSDNSIWQEWPLILIFLLLFLYFSRKIWYRMDQIRSTKATYLKPNFDFLSLDPSHISRMKDLYRILRIRLDGLEEKKTKLQVILDRSFLLMIFLVLVFVLFPSKTIALSTKLGPMGVLALGLFMILLILLYSSMARRRYAVPVLFIILFVWYIFSFSNNNHKVRYAHRDVIERQSNHDHFQQWLLDKHGKGIFSTDTAKIYLVAGEGGGIRGAYWAAHMLHLLDSIVPNFMDQCYAISSVSGSSIGVMFEMAQEYDTKINGLGTVQEDITNVLGKDFATPVLSGLLFGDLFQNFLPFPVSGWDRSRLLEDTWSYYYRQEIESGTLDSAFLNLWPRSDPYRLPSIFYNTTHAESGRKAIYSNVRLDETFFPGAYDVLLQTEGDVPLKSAALLGARFPVITPPALLDKAGLSWGNVVDGGIYDNTGLSTVLSLLNVINDSQLLADSSFSDLVIEPTVIFLKNSAIDSKNLDQPAPNTFAAANFIKTFYASWGANANSQASTWEVLQNELQAEFLVLSLSVENDDEKFALGWTLSKPTQQRMTQRIRNARDTISKYLIQ